MKESARDIHFFNTLTRKKERFVPLEKGKVKMYTCGPTVYDFSHIGNFRAFIFEDLLKRWLEYRGFKVDHVMNLTDVDDKTIAASRELGTSLTEYTDRYVNAFFEDLAKLNVEKADHYPKATEHIPEMVALIKTLTEKGYAYRGKDESLYYDISKFPEYGRLSGVKMSELKTGARVKTDEYAKEEAHDFALWKAWDNADGDVYWDTELGKGRPGWHIECSAMSMKYLGETLDIHCGGVDNLFPHHENEIAQSEAATGKKFVNYWLHNEHLLVEGKRMAKSFHNYYTLDDLMKKGYDPKTVRYLLLSTHYRQQFNFTFEGLEAAKGAIDRLRNFIYRVDDAEGKSCAEGVEPIIDRLEREFGEAMDDDLNIGVALASLFDFVREINNLLDAHMVSRQEATQIQTSIRRIDSVLGVIGEITAKQALPKDVEELIREREEARKAKNWERADKIREELRTMGVTLEDTPEGVRWRMKPRAAEPADS